MEQKLTHFDQAGNAIMVDVSEKEITRRTAIAIGSISMNEAAFEAVSSGTAKKGDVLGVARVAGLMALKRTSDLIPMCHPLLTEKASIDFKLNTDKHCITVTCQVFVHGKTGVEMEALCGASVALLTIYDMCKALDKCMVINHVQLIEKQGGKSGHFINQNWRSPYAEGEATDE